MIKDQITFLPWLKAAMTIPRQDQAIDLASWRHWLVNAMVTLVVLFTLPAYLFFIFPAEWERHYLLACTELVAYGLGFFNILTKGRTIVCRPFIWLILLQTLMFAYFFCWGPGYSTTAWMVMCTILWAAFYGLWPSLVSVAAAIGALCVLYWVVRPGNEGWRSFYADPQISWASYLAILTWICLVSGITVGFLLGRMDSALKSERRTRKRLEQNEFRFRTLFESDPHGILLCDMQGRILDANRSVIRALQYKRKEIIGKPFTDFMVNGQPVILEKIISALKAGIYDDSPYEYKYRNKNGTEAYAIARGWLITDEHSTPLAIGFHIRDISEEKALKSENSMLGRQLQQAQKLEAIGTLAGGIAHDFNNLLSGIIGYGELAQLDLDGNHQKVKTYLTKLLAAGQRARELVQQILRFSRQEKSQKGPMSVSAVVKEVIKLLQSTIPSTIRIEAQVGKETMMITADATQIHQVVMNLCTNAYQAMRKNFGTLGIALEKIQLEEKKKFLSMIIDPGEYVRLTISDTGEGIAPDHMEKIFDPYFTTKRTGEGTGLGLSVTVGIIKEHGGLIEAHSTPNSGSVFTVYLPFEQKAEQELPIKEIYVHAGENEQIMVIDDEHFFLDIVSEHLSRLGYRVEAYLGSVAALDAFRQNPDKFDLVISDQTMPEMTGLQLLSEFKRIRPDITMILCTGYSDQATEQEIRGLGIASMLMKPVTRREMAETVYHVLATRAGSKKA